MLILAGSLFLAGSSGFLVSKAFSNITGNSTKTTTINIANGIQGPKGDPGPQGIPGPKGENGLICPSGFSEGYLVINHPGGQTTTFTCLKD